MHIDMQRPGNQWPGDVVKISQINARIECSRIIFIYTSHRSKGSKSMADMMYKWFSNMNWKWRKRENKWKLLSGLIIIRQIQHSRCTQWKWIIEINYNTKFAMFLFVKFGFDLFSFRLSAAENPNHEISFRGIELKPSNYGDVFFSCAFCFSKCWYQYQYSNKDVPEWQLRLPEYRKIN